MKLSNRAVGVKNSICNKSSYSERENTAGSGVFDIQKIKGLLNSDCEDAPAVIEIKFKKIS